VIIYYTKEGKFKLGEKDECTAISHYKLYRLDGPSIEWENYSKEWWVDGKKTKHNRSEILD